MIIHIKNLRIKTLLGLHDFERVEKQPVVINIRMEIDGTKAAKSDKVSDTVNYEVLIKEIVEGVEKAEFFLLEKLTDFVTKIVMKNKKVIRAEVEIEKPKAPIVNIDNVSVTCLESRK